MAGHGEGGGVALLAAREKKIASLSCSRHPARRARSDPREQRTAGRCEDAGSRRQAKIGLRRRSKRRDTEKGGQLPQACGSRLTARGSAAAAVRPRARVKNIRQLSSLCRVPGTQVPPHHAERLAQLARARKKGGPWRSRTHGLNHLLVKATYGEGRSTVSRERPSAGGSEGDRGWLAKSNTAPRESRNTQESWPVKRVWR